MSTYKSAFFVLRTVRKIFKMLCFLVFGNYENDE
jgi:hypothetical protein